MIGPMKTRLVSFFVLIVPLLSFAQATVNLKIEHAEMNGGKIYVSVFNSESNYRDREVYLSFTLEANNETATKDLSLPNGQYVFSVFQDGNGNGKLDTNLIGIPREKFGFSNYDGKSAPGSFDRHKVVITESSKDVNVTLYKL
jgi:uncharacterized protein (DUF2141 family)